MERRGGKGSDEDSEGEKRTGEEVRLVRVRLV